MLRYLAITWIAVFLAVLAFYSGILPLAVAVDLSIYRPIPVVFRDDAFDRAVMVVDNCGSVPAAVFWFHWGYDGPERRDDWEPIVVALHSGGIHVYARAHYIWRELDTVFNGSRPVVLFGYLWHTPMEWRAPVPGTVAVYDYSYEVSDTHPAEIDVCRAMDVCSSVPSWIAASAGAASLVTGALGIAALAISYIRRSV